MAGTHDAFLMLLSQLAGHSMPEANERQLNCHSFALDGWPNHPVQTAFEKPSRRLLFNTAIGGPREIGFPKCLLSLGYTQASLDRFHSTVRTAKPVEHV